MPVFRPTKAMKRARFILQRSCPPHILKTLEPEDPNLPEYVAPFPVTTVKKWAKEVRGFWQWFLTPCDYEPKFMEAKELALQFYVSVLKLPHQNAEGEIDKGVLNAKLKISERLVGSKEDHSINVSLQQNTQQLNRADSHEPLDPSKRIPQVYKKNPDLLSGKVMQLREARYELESREDQETTIEGEKA